MAIDWLTALGSADQSLEANLARRDVSKLQQLLMAAAQEKTQKEQFGEKMELERKSLTEQMALRRQAQEAMQLERDKQATERDVDNRRQRAFGIHGTLQPGGSIAQTEMPLMQEFGLEKDFSPDEADPLKFVYQAEQFKQKLAQAESQETIRQKAEERAQQAQILQQKAAERDEKRLQMAQKDQERRNQAEQRNQEKHRQNMQKLNKQATDDVPVHLRPQFNKLVEDKIKENEPGWFDFTSEAYGREQAIREALDEIKKLVPGAVKATPASPPAPTAPGNKKYKIIR